MTQESSQETKGSTTDVYIPVQSDAATKTDSLLETPLPNDRFGLRYISPLIKSLEENLSFTAILISIIGYIVISSFGHMDSVAKYLGYVGFLFGTFILYKLIGKNRIQIEIDFKNVNKVLFIVTITLVIFLLVEHSVFITMQNFILSLIPKK